MSEEMSTRDAMAEIIGKMSADAGDPPVEVEAAPEPATADPAPDSAAPVEQSAADKARDERGRFAKAAADKKALDAKASAAKPAATSDKPAADAPPVADPAAQAAAAASAPPALKAPADWRPQAREEFAKLPRVVQEEAIRLHLETKKTLQDSAQARQTAEAFTRSLAPYEHMFRASGKSLPEGAAFLAQSYATLQTAPLPQRAQLIGGLIRDFLGTDDNAINLLASSLQGQPAPAQSQAAQSIRPEQVQQMVRAEAQRLAAEQQQQGEAKAISDFEASQPEFLSTVTQEMLALATIEKRAGKTLTPELLSSVYERAIRMNPETAAVLSQRQAAEAAKKRNAEQPRRAAAAASIRSEPGGRDTPVEAEDTRAEVERQFRRANAR